MKNFKLEENEEVVVNYQDVLIKANENEYVVTLILTNKRLVLLKNVSGELIMNQYLKARGIDIPSDYEVIFDINKEEIKEITYKNSINSILFLHNSNKLSLYCDDLTKHF